DASSRFSDEEIVNRFKNRTENGDGLACANLGSRYLDGDCRLQQDPKKGLKLLLHAVELGSTKAHYRIAWIYDTGQFMEKDHEKAIYHYSVQPWGDVKYQGTILV
ncbi:hypothetical protein ACHAXR_000724, partial [Thalassiosira sp. AJA248-18]